MEVMEDHLSPARPFPPDLEELRRGLGKTITALALAKHFVEEWPVLVIAPAPLCRVWQDQALRWLPKLLAPKDVVVVRSGQEVVPTAAKMVVVSYNLLSAAQQDSSKPGSFREFQIVIVDECHQLRGQSSKRAQAVVPLARRAKHALLLTGTPLVARAEDAYPLLEILLPEGELPSVNDFAARYGRRGAQRLQELHALLGSVMLRRTKVEMLPQLPKKRRRRVLLDLGPSAPSASPAAREEPVEEACERLAKAKTAAVAEYLSCLLAANVCFGPLNVQVRFLVFAHHLAMLDALEKSLREQSVRYFRIDGSTVMTERSKYIDSFQTTDYFQVALLSLTACSQGFTLSAASLVVFAELFWVPGTLLQAEDRAHRLGQESMVDVHYLVAPGTVDERMLAAVERRARDADKAVDGGTATAPLAREGGILEAPVVEKATALEEVASGAKRKTAPKESDDDLVLIGPRSSG
ncbi:DNA annealing helicase and endonuclease ZRANB3, partial [Symbiodinium microadriaticum]